MALGTPVISTDCPTGPRDLLDRGDCGLLVQPGDVDAMTEAILSLLADESLRARLVANGAKKAQTLAPAAANRRMLGLIGRLPGNPVVR
jgi:glycosyltransferase involved in cell wall biosynthesis